jgi:hypothetical protein
MSRRFFRAKSWTRTPGRSVITSAFGTPRDGDGEPVDRRGRHAHGARVDDVAVGEDDPAVGKPERGLR